MHTPGLHNRHHGLVRQPGTALHTRGVVMSEHYCTFTVCVWALSCRLSLPPSLRKHTVYISIRTTPRTRCLCPEP